MRLIAHRTESPPLIGPMAWMAIASFVAGFGGYLAFGLINVS